MNITQELQGHLDQYRKELNFNSSAWIEDKCKKLAAYFEDSGLSGCVVSVSGGVDSAVTLALCLKAKELYPDTVKSVVAINQPIYSSSWAQIRAGELCEKFKTELHVINQTPLFEQLSNLVDTALEVKGEAYATGQLKSYMRTPVNYYVAQLMTQKGLPSVVIGTGNKDEDGYLAYFCKAGDGVVDIQLIADLHKSQVFQVGKELDVPASILTAEPSADLWEGQSDEKELGFTYDFIELYTGHYLNLDEGARKELLGSLSMESRDLFLKCSQKCNAVHEKNKHKLKGVINL